MKIVLAGCTGFIGSVLVEELLKEKHELYLLTRNPDTKKDDRVYFLKWDAESVEGWASEVDGADAVINLTGESIADKRWTDAQKKKIVESRVLSTRVIVDAILKSKKKPAVYINASAVGYYGAVPDGEVIEETKAGDNFLAKTCLAWEAEAKRGDVEGVRAVQLRIGVVLEKDGGALKKMIPPFKLFAGGPLGSGKQWMPWIHRDDVIEIIKFALSNKNISGPINTTAPNPVRMKEFCQELGKALDRPSWAPVPSIALKVLLGEMADMLLGGQKAVPEKLLKEDYQFKYSEIDKALKAIL